VRVVYQIHFSGEKGYYVMDMGDYGYEKEVLITDGFSFCVESVENELDFEGNQIVLITLQYGFSTYEFLTDWSLYIFDPISSIKGLYEERNSANSKGQSVKWDNYKQIA